MLLVKVRRKVILALYLWLSDYMDWLTDEMDYPEPEPDSFGNYLHRMFRYSARPMDNTEIPF